VQALVDSGAMDVFINYSLIEKYYINTYKLSKSIVRYNLYQKAKVYGVGFEFILEWKHIQSA